MSLTPEQSLDLGLAHSWEVFHRSQAGQDFEKLLTELQAAAMNAIDECDNYQPENCVGLVIRRQQRSAVIQAIRNHIAARLQDKADLMDLMQLQREEETIHEHNPNYPAE